MWTPVLLILGLVGAIILVAVLVGKEPPPEDERQVGASPLDRFLAEARGERQTRESKSPSRSIPTARPRTRPTTAPAPRPQRQPQPEPEQHPVIIREAPSDPLPIKAVPVEIPRIDPLPRQSTPALDQLHELLRNRDSLRAALLLSEILQPPRCRRPHRMG